MPSKKTRKPADSFADLKKQGRDSKEEKASKRFASGGPIPGRPLAPLKALAALPAGIPGVAPIGAISGKSGLPFTGLDGAKRGGRQAKKRKSED